jgi:acid phosphatase type 7
MKMSLVIKTVILLSYALAISLFSLSQVTIIPFGSNWKYLDDGSNQGTAWRDVAFSDNTWASGNAELGYGDTDQATVVSYGPSSSNKFITTYFRKTINITDPSAFTNFTLTVEYDDGAIVYVNGTEVARARMTNPVSYTTLADSPGIEDQTSSFTLPSSAFSAGANTIAVEIHQQAVTSSDISFNLRLIGNDAFSGILSRGAYLNVGGQTSIIIRWRTNTSVTSRVELGTEFGTYPIVVSNGTNKTEHELQVTNLQPDTKYYYRIGTNTMMGIADANTFFVTAPPPNTTRILRFAVFGDCGRDDNNFQTGSLEEYQAYLASHSIEAADGMMLLGDNAYANGTDAQFTNQFFAVYGPTILKNHKLYPSPGNHDYDNGAQPGSRTLPYYQSFTMPANGEIGGVASGTEAFYSFDIGDIHFLSLDSYGTEAGNTKLYDTAGVQVTWIKNDLAATNKKWVIAFWHHPPYTKGGHNSDTESDLRGIRENFIRILERNGVDMIMCGHSHDYERSYLLKGYYKVNPGDAPLTESNFSVGTHAVTGSNGKYDGSPNSCVYTTRSGKYNHGTVYVLSGSSGADNAIVNDFDGYPHNALPNSIDDGGMFYFEVDNNRLDAKFIRRNGAIDDKFTIMKDVNRTDTIDIIDGDPVTLTASWPGNYNWSTGATTRSITFNPPTGPSTYTVSDGLGCIADQFAVYANVCNGTTNTWIGRESSAWENPLNWSCGILPGPTTDVIVNHGTFKPVVNSDVTVKSVTVSAGINIVVNTGFRLELTGN